jgi:glycosyltransferase involved in cell wall biosynthesis
MRALVVAHNVPWPPRGGGILRLANVVESMARTSELDLFILHETTRSTVSVPEDVPVARATGVQFPRTSSSLRWRLEWALRRGVPLEVVMARPDTGPRRALEQWAEPPYDVVWFSTPANYEWTGRPHLGPTVVDLMDLEDLKAEVRSQLLHDRLHSERGWTSLRTRLAWYQARVNRRDWQSFQRSVASHVERIVVPSELDAIRSSFSNVAVVPNTYPRPRCPAGDPAAERPPVVLLQGSLGYPPNIDAAHWLATSIAPMIRSQIPSLEVRLVGRPATSIQKLHAPGVVTVVGEVPSMSSELARASVAVVPIRYGGGTRVKILESFAHRVPVVSTTLGAEGLDVEDGVHLLIADDPDEFAAATVRLIEDPALRTRIAGEAERLYLTRYDGQAADEGVRRLLEDLSGLRTRS